MRRQYLVSFAFFSQMTKTKTKTFIFVLEAPRDQDPGLEDYISAFNYDKCFMRDAISLFFYMG